MDKEAEEGRVKPRLTKADQDAYMRACELRWNQPVMLGGIRCLASGARGAVLVFKVKGRLKDVHAGDPRLLTLTPCD